MNAPSIQSAIALHQAGRMDEAATQYRRILELDPCQVDALYLLALITLERGQAAEAEELLGRACALRPQAALLQFHRARSLRVLHRLVEAEETVRRALKLDPKMAEAHQLLGNLLKAERRYREALPSLREAARLAPADPVAHLNLGVACLELGEGTEALASFGRAVELAPDRADARNVYGHALFTFGRAFEGRAQIEQALRLNPSYAPAHDNLGRIWRALGEPEKAVAEFEAAMRAKPLPATCSNYLSALSFVPGMDPGAVRDAHQQWGRSVSAAPSTAAGPTDPPRPTQGPTSDEFPAALGGASVARKLRIGFVSPDLVHHAVSYFFEPLLEARPRDEWECFCYSNALIPDRVTGRLREKSDAWRDIAGFSDDQARAAIQADHLDVLVDLAGHTARNRLLLFTPRLAPVQITWLGYPNTTGLPGMDFRITDAISDPEGETDGYYTEKLIRLPHTFSCYGPPPESPDVAAPPSARGEPVTFGSFNQLAKMNAPVIELWSRVLNAVPASRLLLRSAVLADAAVAADVRARFGGYGISPDRLLLSGERLSVHDHLRAYERVDIALDPFPYNGTTTTCEALWMGVPVITLAGRTHAARVGVSLLTHLGCPEWIASTSQAYVALAAALAQDLPRRIEARRTLRERMRAGPLCDAAGFAREFTAAVRRVWAEAGGPSQPS